MKEGALSLSGACLRASAFNMIGFESARSCASLMSALAKDFDAIIVGPRVAGSAAAILLARAAFPSFRFARLMAAASRAA